MRKLSIFFINFLLVFTLYSCTPIPRKGGYEHPDFETKYTKEEHIERITARTEERFQEDIENGFLVDIFVDIVYAFYDEDPEYFLVEIEYKEETAYTLEIPYNFQKEYGEKYMFMSKHKHFVGFINNDHYVGGFIALRYPNGIRLEEGFMVGESPYTVCGYKTAKKYYGYGTFGVETDEGILRIYRARSSPYEYCIEKDLLEIPFVPEIVKESDYKILMERNKRGWGQY